MITRVQLNPLVKALTWLTWLTGASLVLISLLCVTGWQDSPITSDTQSTKASYVDNVWLVSATTPMLTKGKDLFVANCEQCHEVTSYKVVVGPSLLGVSPRVPSRQWLVN